MGNGAGWGPCLLAANGRSSSLSFPSEACVSQLMPLAALWGVGLSCCAEGSLAVSVGMHLRRRALSPFASLALSSSIRSRCGNKEALSDREGRGIGGVRGEHNDQGSLFAGSKASLSDPEGLLPDLRAGFEPHPFRAGCSQRQPPPLTISSARNCDPFAGVMATNRRAG